MKKNVLLILSSFLSLLSLSLDMNLVISDKNNIFKMDTMTLLIFFILIIYFYKKIGNKKTHISKKILSLLFSIFMIIGNSYMCTNTSDLLFHNINTIILSIISIIGYYILFNKFFILLDESLLKFKNKNIKSNNKVVNKIITFIDEKPFISSMIIILFFWLIYIIAFYPIILSPDPSYQIKQFFNVHTKYSDYAIQLDPNVNLTNHHPVIHTLLLGGCLKLGRLVLNDNFGLFIYSLIQILVLSSTLSYTIKYAKKLKVNNKIRMIMLLIYSLVPMFALYAMSGVKDTIYTALIILYVVFLFDFVKFYKEKKLEISKAILIILLLILLAMFRNNGLYVIILSFPFIIFYSKKNRIKTLVIFILFFTTFNVYSKVVLPYFKITNGSIREVLSIPFQQTARYVNVNEKDLSGNDKKVIDKVLGYENIKNNYNPKIADPIKNNFNKYTTNKELKEYLNVWVKGLFKHPETYIEATINNTYGYFYPSDHNWYVYYKYDNRVTENNLVNYHYNNLNKLRDNLKKIALKFPYIPVIGLISNVGFSTWILLIISAYLIEKKRYKYLIILSPLLVSLLVCIASPVNNYFRYAMPYVFVIPFLLGTFISLGGQKDEK